MAELNRRAFLSMMGAAPFVPHLAAGANEGGAKYKACVIGDSTNGGYGHSLHLFWDIRDDVEVVALADPDEAGRQRFSQECGAQRTYAHYREMLEREAPDLVVIAPRTTVNHKDYLLACAEAGVHGIIEKPLTPDLAEADEVIEAIDARNLKWSIALNFRTSPVTQYAKRLIFEEGLIGKVLEVRSRGKEDHRAGGEDLIVLGVHNFDLMIDFLGMPAWCAAEITQDGRPVTPADVREATEPLGPVVGDTIHAMFGFPGGTTGYFASRAIGAGTGGVGKWGVDVYGTEGIVAIRMTPIPEIYVLKSTSWTGKEDDAAWEPLQGAPDVPIRHPRIGYYAPIIDDLIAAIEEDRQPIANLHDGRNAHEMIQAVFACPAHGGHVTIPMKDRAHPLTRWKQA